MLQMQRQQPEQSEGAAGWHRVGDGHVSRDGEHSSHHGRHVPLRMHRLLLASHVTARASGPPQTSSPSQQATVGVSPRALVQLHASPSAGATATEGGGGEPFPVAVLEQATRQTPRKPWTTSGDRMGRSARKHATCRRRDAGFDGSALSGVSPASRFPELWRSRWFGAAPHRGGGSSRHRVDVYR
jgi:hypothetical protein